MREPREERLCCHHRHVNHNRRRGKECPAGYISRTCQVRLQHTSLSWHIWKMVIDGYDGWSATLEELNHFSFSSSSAAVVRSRVKLKYQFAVAENVEYSFHQTRIQYLVFVAHFILICILYWYFIYSVIHCLLYRRVSRLWYFRNTKYPNICVPEISYKFK